MISKYYKMNPSDPASVELVQFPSNAEALGTDLEGNIVKATIGAVKVNSSDPTAGYLEDKLADTIDVTWDPITDNSKIESTIIQLTGRGASLVNKNVVDSGNNALVHNKGPGISGFMYGRSCSPGYIYKKDLTTNTFVKISAWLAQSSDGTIFTSLDKFVTAIKDTSLSSNSIYTSEASSEHGAHCIHYGKVNSTDTNHAWIVFKHTYHGFFYIPDVEASYNEDGTFKPNAWMKVSNSNILDTITHAINTKEGGILLTGTYMNGVTYYTNLNSTGSCKSLGEEVGGIATDSYGTYLVVARNSGKIYRNNSEKSGTFNNNWVALATSDGLTVDGKSVNNFPITGSGGGLDQTWWAGFGCAYGLWVCTVALKHSPSDPIYAYSDNGLNWTTYGGLSDQTITTWDMKSDGTFWFGCPTNSSSPLVYQIIVNSIPAHKRLIAEKGLMVAGDEFLVDMPNATSLGTDENGKIVAKFDNTSISKKYYSSNPDVVKDDSGDIMAVSASFNNIDTAGWLTNEIVELDFHLMMVPLKLNGSLTIGGRAVVNVVGPPRQVFFLFENTNLDTVGIFQIQGLMNDRPSASSAIDTANPRSYKVTLEIEKNGNVLSVRGGTVSIPYYVSGTTMVEGILSYGFSLSNTTNLILHPGAVTGSMLEGAFDHVSIGLNLDWLRELAPIGCENFSGAFVADTSLTAILEVNRIKKGA